MLIFFFFTIFFFSLRLSLSSPLVYSTELNPLHYYSSTLLQEVVLALRGLAGLLDDNTKHSRQRLRGDIEKQSLHINQEFVAAFAPVQQV